jgi:hypothetical protein
LDHALRAYEPSRGFRRSVTFIHLEGRGVTPAAAATAIVQTSHSPEICP